MAVYKRNYKRYDGPITDRRWRFSILPRYAFQSVFEKRLFLAFFVVCFIPSVIGAVLIYIHANAGLVELAGLGNASELTRTFAIDTPFFMILFRVQTFLVFILGMFVGPGLVSPDLTNNALPLYLSRPFSRTEYVIGKMCVVTTLASLITWVPGLILFLVQSNLEDGWMSSHLRIAAAIFAGSWLWILLVALLSLATSAWVKLKPLAAASMFGVFFVAAAFGELSHDILGIGRQWGILMNITEVMNMIWTWLFDGETTYRTLPVWSAFISIGFFYSASLYMLWKKIRACEVVR
jgi:ABC-2 type transport system permease protein